MRPNLDPRLANVKVRTLDMRLEDESKKQTTDDLTLADEQLAGRVFAGMVYHSRLTDLAVANAFGLGETSKISKWKQGDGLPKFFVRMVKHLGLREGIVKAVGDIPGDDIFVKSVIEVDHERTKRGIAS